MILVLAELLYRGFDFLLILLLPIHFQFAIIPVLLEMASVHWETQEVVLNEKERMELNG